MVFVLLTYGGWNEAAYVSAEVESPGRNMVRALVWSILILTGLYLLVNWAYLRGLGHAGVAASTTVAADLVERATGTVGAQLVSALIVLAAIASVNATILTGARTAYALGRDFPPIAFLGRWSPRTETPVNALLIQGGIALALAALGGWTRNGFATMVEYTAPVFWLFLLLTGVSLFVLRRTAPAAQPFGFPCPVTARLLRHERLSAVRESRLHGRGRVYRHGGAGRRGLVLPGSPFPARPGRAPRNRGRACSGLVFEAQ
jgi:amino acid transporter